MSLIKWLKGLFSARSGKDKYNLLIVRSKNKPKIVYPKSDDPEQIITIEINNGKVCAQITKSRLKENVEFEPMFPEFLLSKIPGKESLWFVRTTATKNVKLGKGYFYYIQKNKNAETENRWHGVTDSKFMTEFMKRVAQQAVQQCVDGNKDSNKVEGGNQEREFENPTVPSSEIEKSIVFDNPTSEITEENDTISDPKSNEEKTQETPKDSTLLHSDYSEENENCKEFVLKLLKNMGYNNLSDDTDIKILLDTLSGSIKNLQSKFTKSQSEVSPLQKRNNQCTDELIREKTAKKVIKEDNEKLSSQIVKLKGEIEAQRKHGTINETCLQEKDTENSQLKCKVEELKKAIESKENELKSKDNQLEYFQSSEVGQLTLTIEDLNRQLQENSVKIEELLKEDKEKKEEIEEKDKIIIEGKEEINNLKENLSQAKESQTNLEGQLVNARKESKLRADQCKKLEDEKEYLSIDLNIAKEEIKEIQETLKETENKLQDSSIKIETLERNVKKLEEENYLVLQEKEEEIEQKNKLSNTLKNDISSQISMYQNIAESLVNSLNSVFLKECNEDEETDTIESMCAKISKGVKYVASEIEGLKEKDFGSTIEVKNAYKQIIAENIESYAFTEIARWWAYSRLAFILDGSREEGRSIDLSAIEKAYDSMTQLLYFAGYRYQIPILFVQNLKEGDYENLTGKEQLNLDYQVPNVRSHVEKIDRDDCENVVLDIVRLGYYEDNKLVKKTSVITQ